MKNKRLQELLKMFPDNYDIKFSPDILEKHGENEQDYRINVGFLKKINGYNTLILTADKRANSDKEWLEKEGNKDKYFYSE